MCENNDHLYSRGVAGQFNFKAVCVVEFKTLTEEVFMVKELLDINVEYYPFLMLNICSVTLDTI